MILEATSLVFGSSANLSANVLHTFSSASDISRIVSGSNDWLARNGRIGIIASQTFQVGAHISCSQDLATPKVPSVSEEPVSVPLISQMCDGLKRLPLCENFPPCQ